MHEPMLRARLRGRFPSQLAAHEVGQEAFLRVLGGRESGRGNSSRAFLFAASRNHKIDRLRRGRIFPAGSLTEIDRSSVKD